MSSCGTVFSPERLYRYTLARQLQPTLGQYLGGARGGLCAFVCLNPSTADEQQDDPTVRRCMAYATRWGYDELQVLNLFAWRSTDPAALYAAEDPVGPENDAWLELVASAAELVACAWGTHGAHLERGAAVLEQLRGYCRPHCLTTTQGGHPGHPLYLPGSLSPRPLEEVHA